MFDTISDYHYANNLTLLSIMTPTTLSPPIYHTFRPSLLSWISDKHLSLLAPIVVYWALSLVFHTLDTLQLPYFEKRRIHESPEVLARNKASVMDVVKAVVVQQVIQTAIGTALLEGDDVIIQREVMRDHLGSMAKLAPRVGDVVLLVLGKRTGEDMLRSHGSDIVTWVYWWGIPIAQTFFAL